MYLLFQQSSADVLPPRASLVPPTPHFFLHSVCGTPRFQTIVLGFAWESGPPVHKSGIRYAPVHVLRILKQKILRYTLIYTTPAMYACTKTSGLPRRATLIVKRSSTPGALLMQQDLCLNFILSAKLNSSIHSFRPCGTKCLLTLFILHSSSLNVLLLVPSMFSPVHESLSKHGVSIRGSAAVVRLLSSCLDIT